MSAIYERCTAERGGVEVAVEVVVEVGDVGVVGIGIEIGDVVGIEVEVTK